MSILKRSLLVGCVFLLTTLFVACGTTTTGSSGGSGGSTPTPTTAPALTPTTAASAFINTTTVTISGKDTSVLTDSRGYTLYYLTKDSATKVTCTGGCASNWPPLLFTGSGTPTVSTSLPAKLTVFQGADGNQIEYDGHPLYTFAGDSGPHQTHGQGVAGVWYVMQPTAYSTNGY